MSIGRHSGATEQDLVARADGHSLGKLAGLGWNREDVLYLHGLAIDYHDRAPWPGAVHWNILVKLPSLRTPLALLEAAGGIRRAVSAGEIKLTYDRVAGGVDKRDEGRSLSGTCDHNHMIMWIVAELIRSGCGEISVCDRICVDQDGVRRHTLCRCLYRPVARI